MARRGRRTGGLPSGATNEGESYVSPMLKYILFFFNLLFWVMGVALIFTGVWAYIEKNKFTSEQQEIQSIYDIIFNVSVIIIVIGCVVFILAFSGCVGALRENICLLKFFSFALALLFLLECVGAILAFVFSNQVKSTVEDVIQDEMITRYRDPAQIDLMNFMDFIQKTFQCCGASPLGYMDWNKNEYFNCSKENVSPERCAVPFSCCIKENNVEEFIINTMCGFGMQEQSNIKASKSIYVKGCVDSVLSIAQDNLLIVGGISIGVAVVQIFAVFMGLVLARQIKDQMEMWKY